MGLMLLMTDYFVPGIAFTYGIKVFPFGDRERENKIIKKYRSGMLRRSSVIVVACVFIYLDVAGYIGSWSGGAVIVLIIVWLVWALRDIFAANRA